MAPRQGHAPRHIFGMRESGDGEDLGGRAQGSRGGGEQRRRGTEQEGRREGGDEGRGGGGQRRRGSCRGSGRLRKFIGGSVSLLQFQKRPNTVSKEP